MLLNLSSLVELESLVLKQCGKTREKLKQESNARIVNFKILACFERIKDAIDKKIGIEEEQLVPQPK
jgi:hypothetical protein